MHEQSHTVQQHLQDKSWLKKVKDKKIDRLQELLKGGLLNSCLQGFPEYMPIV